MKRIWKAGNGYCVEVSQKITDAGDALQVTYIHETWSGKKQGVYESRPTPYHDFSCLVTNLLYLSTLIIRSFTVDGVDMSLMLHYY